MLEAGFDLFNFVGNIIGIIAFIGVVWIGIVVYRKHQQGLSNTQAVTQAFTEVSSDVSVAINKLRPELSAFEDRIRPDIQALAAKVETLLNPPKQTMADHYVDVIDLGIAYGKSGLTNALFVDNKQVISGITPAIKYVVDVVNGGYVRIP